MRAFLSPQQTPETHNRDWLVRSQENIGGIGESAYRRLNRIATLAKQMLSQGPLKTRFIFSKKRSTVA
jgi:hypothetical protein